MKKATLCFMVRKTQNDQLLLGLKKRGIGCGKFNGFGGKVKENETVEEAVLRELYEETSIKSQTKDIRKVGELTFLFPSVPEWDKIVHVFLIDGWEGEPIETDEMRPIWFDFQSIPFEKMWQDDKHWLPLILQDKKVRASFVFKEDNERIQDMKLEEIEEF